MPTLNASLSDTHVPRIGPEDAQRLAQRLYGLQALARPLTGERDRNFHLTTPGGEYVLKISNALEDPAATAFQNAMLAHLEHACPDVPVPRLVRTLDATQEAIVEWSGVPHIVRLVTWLPGTPLDCLPPSASVRRQVAHIAARMDTALATFEWPYEDTQMLWNIARSERIRPLLEAVADDEDRRRAGHVLERFAERVAPVLAGLPAQFIHNDLNLHNLILDDQRRISGVIDFGDAVKAPVVCDLATAAAYQLFGLDDPVPALVEMVAAFHALCPLTEQALDVVFDLVRARYAITLGIGHWRAARHPSNEVYILRNAPPSARALEVMEKTEPEAVAAALRQACGNGGEK